MAESSEKPIVLVTGASGYVATHVVKILAQEGYKVRGTVRSLKNEEKVKPIRELGTEDNPIELCEADLTKEESWLPAVQGCQYVLHIASPFPTDAPANEDEVIKPAVNGALAVLKACRDAGGVKRVVLTSSMAAVNAGFRAREGKPWTEDDFTDPDSLRVPEDAYVKSKTMAEIAAWNFVKELPEDKRFEFAVVNPTYVMGPHLCGSFTASMEIPRRLLQKEMPALPRLGLVVVDVRDIAQAHVNAMTIPEAAGHRHIVGSKSLWLKDIAMILKAEFEPQGYSVPTTELPGFLVKFIGFFDRGIKTLIPGLNQLPEFDYSRMNNVLGIPGKDVKNTILDMAYKMIETNHIKKMAKYTGPKYSDQQ